MGVIAWLVLGALSGWIANRLMKFLTFLELRQLQV